MRTKFNTFTNQPDYTGDGITNQLVGAQIKQYSEAAGDFTITGTGNGTWTTTYAVAVPYQTINGKWRLNSEGFGSFSGATAANEFGLSMSGVVFAETVPITIIDDIARSRAADQYGYGRVGVGSSIIAAIFASGININNIWGFSFDVALESKPAFAEEFPAINLTTSALAVRDSYRNLAASRPSVTTVNVTADELILQNSLGLVYRASGVNVTADITASGANGLDTGSEANSTWYHSWVIYNPTTDTKAGLLSLSATNPTMPSGYTYKAYAGAVYNEASGDFGYFNRQGNYVTMDDIVAITGATNSSFAAIDLSSIIPVNAKRVGGLGSIGATNALYTGLLRIAATSSGTGLGRIEMEVEVNTGSATYKEVTTTFNCPIIESQTIYAYRIYAGTYYIVVNGYEF
jgi:hypothetical protein